MARALEGLRVLDFTQVIFGPVCTQVLADHGAEVIKVEKPGTGDLSRSFGPRIGGESSPFLSLNRGKRSLAVDLKSPAGKQIILELVKRSDVVISNFRPGVMESLGLGYEDLLPYRPDLIYAVGSGYGTSGPLAESFKPGHELLAQSLAGVAYKNACNGLPRALPVTGGDFISGMIMVQAILMALLVRERTGKGQKVELSLLDSLIALQSWDETGRLNLNLPDYRVGNHNSPLQAIYRTKDSFIALVGWFRPNPLGNVCQALGLPDLSQDPRFSDFDVMHEHGDELRAIIQEKMLTKTTAEWLRILEERDILCGPVLHPVETFAHPQVAHNQMVIEMDHPKAGHLRLIGIPIKFSETPGYTTTPAPLLGQHTDEVLRELGYSEAQITELRERRVVG